MGEKECRNINKWDWCLKQLQDQLSCVDAGKCQIATGFSGRHCMGRFLFWTTVPKIPPMRDSGFCKKKTKQNHALSLWWDVVALLQGPFDIFCFLSVPSFPPEELLGQTCSLHPPHSYFTRTSALRGRQDKQWFETRASTFVSSNVAAVLQTCF